jgi:hypothetical protein
MKHLVIAAALALASLTAHATPLAYAGNQVNGMIVLTDEQNNCPTGIRYAYRTNASGVRIMGGCYVVTSDMPFVYLRWLNDINALREYPVEAFTLTAAGRAAGAANAAANASN